MEYPQWPQQTISHQNVNTFGDSFIIVYESEKYVTFQGIDQLSLWSAPTCA